MSNAATADKQPLYIAKGDDGMEAYVWAATMGGYNVTLRDADAGEFLPTFVNVPSYDRAVEIANKWAPTRS